MDKTKLTEYIIGSTIGMIESGGILDENDNIDEDKLLNHLELQISKLMEDK